MGFSELISSLAPSATLAISQKVRDLKAQGRDVIGLTLGEPDMDTPMHIRDAAKKALDDGYTHYPPVPGYPALREAIAAKLKRDNKLNYSPDQVVVSTGAKQSLYNVAQAILNPSDGALLIAPYWVSYEAMVHLARAQAQIVVTGIENNYKVTPDQLDEAMQENTRLVFLTTPSNPTGSMYSKEELGELVKVFEKYPYAYIISDEIYEHITFGLEHVSLGTFESIAERVITVNGFSKGFAMTGWRLGYIAAPKEVAKLCNKVQGQITSGANAFAQMGAVAALGENLEPTYQMRDEFLSRRNMVHEKLSAIDGLRVNMPDGAFYFYPDFADFLGRVSPNGDRINNINDLCLYLIDEVGLALVPGTAFGTQTHARISYAYSVEELNKAVSRLSNGLSLLK
ncbi:MAG: pyridoxal phosphate-dependent aminotransferase [Bacteroidia bacterium]|nr:pyridoxal phosphate-dependent aminotransferase [Bacteroidia bacterium]